MCVPFLYFSEVIQNFDWDSVCIFVGTVGLEWMCGRVNRCDGGKWQLPLKIEKELIEGSSWDGKMEIKKNNKNNKSNEKDKNYKKKKKIKR